MLYGSAATKNMPALVHSLPLTEQVVREVSKGSGNVAPLAAIVRAELMALDLNESDLVYRGLCHATPNIAPHLLARYGTDRFEGYGPQRLPQTDTGLVPFKNKGETEALTADTYVVPDLEWALDFTNLPYADHTAPFLAGTEESFLLMYRADGVRTERMPAGGGEQWRGTFTMPPVRALSAAIRFAAAS